MNLPPNWPHIRWRIWRDPLDGRRFVRGCTLLPEAGIADRSQFIGPGDTEGSVKDAIRAGLEWKVDHS